MCFFFQYKENCFHIGNTSNTSDCNSNDIDDNDNDNTILTNRALQNIQNTITFKQVIKKVIYLEEITR